jgi:hypothetical protein
MIFVIELTLILALKDSNRRAKGYANLYTPLLPAFSPLAYLAKKG